MTATARSKRTFTVGSVVLATLLGFASTSPVLDSIVYDAAPNTCAPHQCSHDATIIEAYNVGKMYEYDYLVDSNTEMRSASPSKQSNLNMVARVKVQVLTPCEFSVKVTNVVMNGKAGASSMDEDLSRYPSEFVLENSQVQRVCSHPQEPEWVTNIKKGVISSFQSTILPEGSSLGFNVTETDVVGICETMYMPTRKNGDFQTYQKIKHMETCRNNQELFQYALNLPDMNIQNLPLMRSEHSCQVTVFGDGRLESSDCTETHVFQPFSSASSGAIANVRRQVKLVGEPTPSATSQRLTETRASSLIFSHPDQKDQASNDQAKLVLALLNSFKSASETAKPEMFSQLVHSMRQLSHSQLLNIFYNGITDPELRILALDAIPLLKTDAGIALMKDIIETGELPSETLNMWFSTLPYYKNPTRAMLGVVSNFLRGEPINSALLGVSSLVSSYCSGHSNCQELPEVQAIITQYEQLLGSQCEAVDRAEEDKVILALKALRTIGHLRRGQAVVEKCYTDATNSMFIRLAAIDTIKQINCGQNEYDFKRQLFATFSDASADSELRIGAYLALMNCPSQSMVNLVKNVLVNEPVNQVGSFVWTHLTNLQESQSLSEHKQSLKTLVGRDFLQNKWRTDVRKFSRYFETSYYAKDLNVGATTDGQIIFSQDSYLPRSGMLNLTATVFGENLHLLEIGSRVEGFEAVFEDLFGPDGYFREDSLHKLLQSLRQKRDSNQDVSGTISDFQQKFNQELPDASPRGNMYMRMFGRDLHYASFEGLDNLLASVTPVSLFSSNSPNLDFSRSSIFLDGKIVVPTLAGFPLDLDVNGTSAVSLKSQNKFDLTNLFKSGDANLEVKLYPTATLQISATMTIDAKHNQVGLKSLSKLHTSTYLDGEAVMEGGKLMKARLNVPKKTVDVLDVSVDFFSMNDQGLYEPLTSQNQAVAYAGCTPDSFNHVVGMKLCGSASYYNNPQDQLDLVFAGPLKMKIGLEKVDTFDKYTFEYQRVPASQGEAMTKMIAKWDTPGSSINRLSKINLVLDESTLNFVKVDVEIPVRKIKINALYRMTDADKVIKASIVMENEVLLAIRQSIQSTEEGKYNVISRVSYKKIDLINLTGTFIATDKKMDVKTNLKSTYLEREIVADGSLVKTNDQWDIDGKIKSKWVNLDVKGLFIQTDTSFDFKSDLRYSGQGYNQAMQIQSSYKLDGSGVMARHTFSLHFDPTNHPEWKTNLRWVLTNADSFLENDVKVKLGKHSYEVEQLFSSQATIDRQELIFALGFKAPERGIAHKIALEHRHETEMKVNRIELMLPGLIKFETHVIYNLVDNQSKRKLDAGLTYFENEMASTLEMVHRPDNSGIDGAAHLRWGQPNDPNTNIKADFKLDQRTPAAIDYAVTANLVVPKSGPMKAEGDVKYVPGKSVIVLLKGKRGTAEFTTSIEVQKIAAGGKLVTILKTATIDYSFNVMLRNDAIKSLHAVLNLDQKYELNAVAKRNFRDILFDLSYGAKPADRVVFNAKLTPTKVVTGLKMLGNEGKLKMERNGKIFIVEGTYNQDKLTMNGELQNMPGDYFLKVDLTSTLKAMKTVKLNLVHKITQDQAKLAVISQAQLVLNAKEHLIKFIGKKDTNILIELETKSAYAVLDKIFLKFEQERVDKKTTNNVKIAYKADAFKLNTIYDNGKPKEGLIMVQTPWETYKTMKVGFLFNFGQQVELDTYCTWNEQSMATANVTGHLKASDIKLDFHMTQSKLGEAKAGVTYQKSSKSVAASTYLGYGENKIILDGVYQATPILANLKLDIKTTPIKANGQLTIKSPTARALDVKSHFEFGNNHRAELTWASTFNSLVEHTVDAKIHVTGTPFYDVILKANNDKGVNALYQMTVMQGQKQLSEVKLDITNEMKTKHAKIVFGWNTIVTSFEVKHVVKGNTEYLSFVRIQSQEKVFLLKHNTKLTGDLKFYSNVELETPYVYMRKASTLVDIDIKPTELKAKATATFNDETLAIKTDGVIRLDNYQVKEVDVKADLDGFLGKMSGDAKFKKVAGQEAFLIGNVNIANKPIKLTLSLKNIEGGAEFVVKVDAETPFSLEGSYSRNADLTHLKEMLALTYKTDLVFKCTSEIEIESWTDIKATGILDVPMIAEQPIDLSALFKLTTATLKAELTVKDILTFTSEVTDKRADIKATLKYLDTYAVALKGEMSGGLKSVMATLTKNAKVWKVEAKVTNYGVEMGFEGIYKCPDYQQQIEAKLDLNAQGISVIYQFLEQKAKLTGSFMCDSPRVCTMAVQMENEFYDALRNIKIEGKLDAAKMAQATVNLIGHANDAEALKVTGTMKETSGDLAITMNLPIVKITDFSAKAVYEISEKEGHATLTVRDTKNVDFSWKVDENLVRVHLITPLTSIKEVSVLAKRVSTLAVKKINLEIDVNSERIISLEGQMERPRAIAVKLTTKFPALRTIEMAFNLNAFTDFHMAAAYNDVFEARLQGLLTRQIGKYVAKLRLPLHMGQAGYIASMEYDLTQHKEFKMILQSNQWKNSLIGYIKANDAKLAMELNGDEVFVSMLKYNLVQSLVGTADFTTKAKFLTKPITVVTKFDLAKEDKKVDVKMSIASKVIQSDMKFKMTHDTFDGVMVLKSDIATYEAATIKAKYNIATEPTAKLQIERNGKLNFVETKLKFDNIIPTVEITTSFPKFEKMLFKGNYNAMEKGHKQLDLALSRNDENIFVFALTSKPSANWKNADIVVTILTPITNWKTLNMELGWVSHRDPYALKIKLTRGTDEISFKGKVSLNEGEFSLKLVTPFTGFESVGLSGKLGTTSLGKHMGITFDNNSVKRDVRFAYDINEDNTATVQIDTPLEHYKSIKIRSMMMADMGSQMDFSFETQGKEDFAIGLKYDFSRGLSGGDLLIKMINNGNNAIDLESKLEYNNVDFVLNNGFDGMYYLKWKNTQLAYAKVERKVEAGTGHTTLVIKTPVEGFENLKMELKSDYATTAFAAVELGKLGAYSADLKRTVTGPTGHTKLSIKTPHPGFELLKMEAKSDYATNAFAAVELGRLGKYSADIKRIVTKSNPPTGHTKLIIITPHAGFESLKMEAKSDYATIAFAAVELGKLGKYSADLKRTVTGPTGHTKLIIITPHAGFESLEMEAKSDYATKLFASVKLGNIGDYSIKVNKVDTTYKVLATTPFKGYEKLMAEIVIKSEGKVVSVKLTRGDKWIGTFTTDVNLSMVSPKFVFKFEGPQNLFAEVKLQYNDGHAQIMWKLPKKTGDINIKYKHDGTTTSAELTAVINGKHVKYFSERVWIVGKVTGESRFETNLQQYFKAKKTEFNYEIKYTKDYTGPWEIFYQRKADGVESALVKLSLNRLADKKFKFAYHVNAPVLVQLPRQLAQQLSPKLNLQFLPKTIDLYGDAEMEIKSDSVMMNLKYKTNTAKVEVKYSPAGASIFVTSNIPTFEKIQAQTKWTLNDKKFTGELQMKRNADVLLDTKLAVDFKPFTHFKFVVNIPTVGVQELEISYNNFANSEGIVTVEAKGIVVLKFTGKLAAAKSLDLLELDVMGKTSYTGDFTFGIKLGLKHDQKNYGINVEFKTKTTVYKFAVEALDVDLIHYKGNLVLLWNLPGLPKISEFKAALNIDVPAMKLIVDVDVNKVKVFNSIVNADVPAKKLTIDVNLKGVKIFELTLSADMAAKKFTIDVNVKGVKVLKLAGEVDWTPAAANIVLLGTLNNKKIELVAKRTGYEKINYSLNVFGKKITFVNANNIRSAKDFDINAALDVLGDKITFVTANKIRTFNDFDVTATLTIAENISKMMNLGKAVQTIGLELKSKPTGAEVLVNGKLSLNAKAFNLDFKMNQAAGEFKLALKGIKNNLMMEYKNKEDGKLFSLKVNDKTIQIFENFSKMGGDYAAPIKFSMTESLQNTQLSLSLNIQDQSFKMKAGRGAKFIEINGKTKLTGTNKYYLRLQGATEAAPKLFDIKGSATYPLEWNLEVTFKQTTKITFVAKAAQDLSECNVDFKIVRGAKEELTTTLKMVNKENEKSVNALFKFKTNTLKMDAKIVPGEIEIEFTSTLPLLKKLEFEVEYKETALKVEFEYNELKFEVKFKHENDVWSFDAKHSKAEQLVNFVEAKFDKNAGTLKFKCKIVGKVMELDVLLSETSVKVEMTEPFTNAGKITLKGDLKQGPDGVSLIASGNVNGVDYVFTGYVGYAGELSIALKKGAEDIKIELNVANAAVGKSLTILVAGSQMQTYKVSVKYALANSVFTARVHAQVPPYSNNVDASFEIGYDYPKKMTLKTKFSHDGDVLVDIDAEFAMAQDFSDVRTTFKFASPPLGVPKMVGIKVVYRLVSATDFELTAEVLTPSDTYKAGAKFQLGNTKIDSQLRFGYGQKEYHMKLGASLASTGTQIDMHQQTFKAYLNNFNLELVWDVPRFFQLYEDGKIVLKLKGERVNADGEQDAIYDLVFSRWMTAESFNVEFVTELSPYFIPQSIILDVQTKADIHLRAFMQYDQEKLLAGYFIKNANFQKSAEVIIQHGKEGVVEITVGGLQKTKMTMQWPTPTNRVTRAIFDSPIYGNYEFLADLDQDINSAIIVLTTSHGIHKFAYQIHNEDKFELTTTVESPLISGGNPLTFHLLLDPVSKTYSSRIKLSEEYFVSVSLGLDIKDMQASFTIKLPPTFILPLDCEGQIHIKNLPKLVSCEMSFTHMGKKHTLKVVFKKADLSLKVIARSPLLLGNEWSIKGNAVVAEGSHQISAVANIANEKIQLQGQIDHRSWMDFGGKIVYQGSSSILAKANVDFKFLLNLESESLIKLEVTSSHPALTQVKVMLSMNGATNGYEGNFVAIFPKVDKIEASFKINTKNLRINGLNITASTLKHQVSADLTWDMNLGVIEGVVLGPKASDKWVIKTKVTSEELVMVVETTRPGMEKIEMKVKWDPESTCEGGNGKLEMTFSGKKMEGELMYNMKPNAKYILASLNTPFQNHNAYELQFGYEDSDNQKQAKAHLTTPKGQLGFLVDFYINSLKDFLFLLEVDLPIPELKLTKIKLGHSIKDDLYSLDLGADMTGFIINVDYRLKCDQLAGATILDVDARYNDISVVLKSYINLEDKKFDFVVKTSTPWGKLEIPLKFASTYDLKFNIIVNDVTRFVVTKSIATGTTSIQVKDIITPNAFKLGLIHDKAQGAASCALELVWDTANAAETTEVVSVSWRNSDAAIEFGSQVTWRSRDTDAVSGKVTRSHDQLQVTVSVLHNNRRDWGLDMSSQSTGQGQDLDHTKKVTVVVPSHAVEYNLHQRERSDVMHCDASLKWSQRDGPKHGLEYVYDVQKLKDDAYSHTLVVRQIGSQVQTFSTRYQTGRASQSVSVDINHSHDLTRRINLEASYDYTMINALRTVVKAKSSYTFGSMPTQRNDVTLSLDEEKFVMEFADSSNIYTCEGKVTHQGIRQVTLAINGQAFSQLFVRMDKDKPLMKADLKFAEQSIRLSGGLKESNIITFNVESQREGAATVVELDTSLVLSSDGRVLKVEFDWRPEMLEESRQVLAVVQDKVVARSQRALPHVLEHAALVEKIVRMTINETAEHIRQSLDIDVAQYFYVYETLVDNVKSLHINSLPVVKVVVTHATKMLTICVKEMTTLAQKTGVAARALVDIVQDVANDAVHFVFEHFKGTWEFAMQIKMAVIDEMAQLEINDFNVSDYVKVAVTVVRKALEKVTEVYKKWNEYLALLPTEVGGELEADIARILNNLSDFLKKFKTFNKVVALYWDYQSWFEEFHLSQHFEDVTSDLRSHFMDIGRELSQLKASLMEYWTKTVGKINGTINDYPLLAYSVSFGKKVVRVAHKMISQMGVEHNLNTWARKIIGQADAVASTLVRIIDVVYHEKDLIGYEFSHDLAAGNIVYKQVIPFQWHSFQDTPDIVKVAALVGLNQPAGAILDLKALQHDILEVIDVVSAAWHTKSVIPPFSATALVAGDSHIITFDQTYYNFAGAEGCSYLLTSDFSHGRFSAIANYDTDMRRTSIDVVTDGHTINIDTTPTVEGLIKVTLDKRNTQLPIQFDHTYAYREENTVVVENSEGLKISCNTVHNVCTFTISGWYFGKTGGLLGVYDNEPSNDWMTSEREIVHTLEEFVNSWAVTTDRQCPVKFFKNSAVAQPTLEEAQACESVFSSTEDSSALMPCFSTIDPEPFKAMCLTDMQAMKNRADKQSGICSSAAAYIKQCKQAGVELWMPGHCVRCEINSQETMANGESTRIQGNAPQSADVVFVVQQSSCLNDLELHDLPLLVDRSLTSKGLTDNRYALVGFAGSEQLNRPHIFTSGSQIFNDVTRMKTSLDHLKTMQLDGSVGAGDIFEALQFSARLNLRAGVVKTFVLVRCDTSESMTSRAYGDSMTMLLEQGISMHVMMPLEMRLKGTTTKLTSKMFGFSKDSVITASALDKDLRRQLKDPKDQVSTLAQESGGAVFDLNRLKSRKRTLAKKASTMMGKALAELSKPLGCEVCDCLADADGKGRVMCHRCVLPSIDIVLQNLQDMLKQ